jgi:yecA family protein
MKEIKEIYQILNKSLTLVGALMSVAEAHGILSGLLCSSNFDNDKWLKHVLGETSVQDGLASECEQQLLLLKNYTLEQLNSPNFEFMPLVPDEDESMQERTQAIGAWCEGFLFGLGLAGVEKFAGDEKEFINDLVSISRIESTGDNDSDENEEHYMQIIEYIKIGVISLYEELTQSDK